MNTLFRQYWPYETELFAETLNPLEIYIDISTCTCCHVFRLQITTSLYIDQLCAKTDYFSFTVNGSK